jgi:carbon-monoxide dehydrogenase small subunit
MMEMIEFTLNGKKVKRAFALNRRLLDVLRDDFCLSGPKEGCGEGECGACAVLMDHKIIHSCSVLMGQVDGKEIMTIEGFSETKRYEILRKAFQDEGAVQCGFCTPGMLIAAESLLNKNPHPSEKEIKVGMSGNLCRCTGYRMIMQAVSRAAEEGDGLW